MVLKVDIYGVKSGTICVDYDNEQVQVGTKSIQLGI